MAHPRDLLRLCLLPVLLAGLCAPLRPARAQETDPLQVHITQIDASDFPIGDRRRRGTLSGEPGPHPAV
jgi:hypothetical protein